MLKTAIAGALPLPHRIAGPGKLDACTACGLAPREKGVCRRELESRAEGERLVGEEIRP